VTRAAIASELAAKIYKLKILKRNIEDEAHNTTRFIVLSRKAKWASRSQKDLITTFVFQVRNIPAALYKALGGFATNGVNMTKLESYMVNGSFAATQFGIRHAAQDAEDPRRLPGPPLPRNLPLAARELVR
jgi:prephenate dehydratase